MLRVPLVLKIAGANALIVAVALVVLVADHALPVRRDGVIIMVGALGLSLVASVGLAALALRPLRDIERTLLTFQAGDQGARVPTSPLADEDMVRVEHTLNRLLDSLNQDRERLRDLASRVVVQNDEERARLARDLYDSTAQSIAAQMLELSVAASTAPDASSQERLERIRRIASDVLEEIRALSHAAHPRVLEDRGLSVALMQLVRESSAAGTARVLFDGVGDLDAVDPGLAVVVYRVAESALTSAVHRRNATNVKVSLHASPQDVVLEVDDDGEADPSVGETAGTLEAVRHRVELVGGTVEQQFKGGRGRVMLRVPRPSQRLAPSRVGALAT